MLIIAIPKSASSSLLHTLGKITKLPHEQKLFPNEPIPEESKVLCNYHSDLRILPNQACMEFGMKDRFFKQHIFPCEENLEHLRNQPKAVLLRPPPEIIAAYWRAEQTHIHKARNEFKQNATMDEWMQAAKNNGLINDLDFFYEGWMREAESHPAMNHVVHYQDLLDSPDQAVKGILGFFNLPIPKKKVALSKKRYSRGSPLRNCLHRLQRLFD